MWVDLKRGSEFHGLRVHGVLAQGAMGVAYLVSHAILRTPLILKLFRPKPPAAPSTRKATPSTCDDPTELADLPSPEAIFQEAELAARVSSPHVVGVVDAGIHEGVPFLVQRYVDGVDLRELVTRAPVALSTAAVVRIVADVARGLAAIHQAGVVHRDVKPANLFLCGDGGALLGDFGIARDRTTISGSDEPIAGTPLFLAPEIWAGKPPTAACDLYALGATAHLLATGEAPFRGDSATKLFYAHTTQPYVTPPQKDPARAYLFATIARLLEKDPAKRPAHAKDVVAMLDRVESAPPRWRSRGEGRASIGEVEVVLRRGDLASAKVDVLVNAANPQLTMDLGVAAALMRVGGEEVEAEAMKHGPQAMGEVVWTGAGKLAAEHVAHAVAAIDGAICIQRAIVRTLLGAREREARSIAMPAIGTGIGEVPHSLGAKLVLETLRTFVFLGAGELERVEIWLYDQAAHDAWRDVLEEL